MNSGKEYQNEFDYGDKKPRRMVEARNWAELPDDILFVIFKKIAGVEILRSAQYVCRHWRNLSYEPALWRCIQLMSPRIFNNMESLAIMAVHRSQGCMEELYVEKFPIMELMIHISERATMLRCLRLVLVSMYDKALAETIIKISSLEELEISHCSIFDRVLKQIAQALPQLKVFRHDERPYNFEYYEFPDTNADEEAFAIAKIMHNLHRLQLFGNSLTNIGLLAILNSCPHLEYLDIRGCYNVCLDENMKKKCARIKVVRLPTDSTNDYEYQAIIDELDAFDADYYPVDDYYTLSESDNDNQNGYQIDLFEYGLI